MATVSESTLSSPILGGIEEVCIVSPDYKKTIDDLGRLGIGPFQVFKFDENTVPRQELHGHRATFSLYACFAKQGSLTFEIMQPISDNTPMAEYLREHGGNEGIQHVAFDMGNIPMAQRRVMMKERGFGIAMQGWWKGKEGECHFCFFDTKGAVGTVFESIEFSDDWEDPEFEWYPHPPQQGAGLQKGVEK